MTRPFMRSAIVIITALSLAACSKKADETIETAGPVVVRTETVKLDSIRASLTVTGAVAPSPGADWTIVAPENGRLAEAPKAEGDTVKEGDVLARFELPALMTEIATRQAETAQANARLQTARSNAARLSGLFARGIASQRDNDDAARELQEAEAIMRQAESGKAATDLVAAQLVVKARFAGVIAHRWHNVGDQVLATTDDPILRVIDPTRLEVVAPVPVASAALIVPGRAVRVFNPTDGSVIDAAVVTLPVITDPAAATTDVRVSLPKTVTLTAGTPVQIEILSDERNNVLVVPTAALMKDGADVYVMVAGTDNKAHRKSVMIGLVAQERTQILSGLVAGDRVILAGADAIADGAAIAIQK